MKKNILVIAGSPRKGGNSDLLCDQFMKGDRKPGILLRKSDSKIQYNKQGWIQRI